MSAAILERFPAEAEAIGGSSPQRALSSQFPPRPVPAWWPATEMPREQALTTLTASPFVLDRRQAQYRRVAGLRLLLDWLGAQPGATWQDRWLASGADGTGERWREVPAAWLRAQGYDSRWRRDGLVGALPVVVSADLLRPSLHWLIGGGGARGGLLARNLEDSRDPDGFARLAERCHEAALSNAVAGQVRYLTAQILAAKGGDIAQITIGDLLELFDAEDAARFNTQGSRRVFYRILREMGIFDPQAPPTLRALRTTGPRSPDELIDRYRLRCRPVRDLLVDYLRERQPALDQTSLESLANFLGNLFWADIERHHPEITTLHLPHQVAEDWKRRLRTITKTMRTADGRTVEQTVERINYRECLTPVRAFYLDLAHWAIEDPARWGPWVAPCPVGEEEINRKKAHRRRKARMDARTRERLPALPAFARNLDQRRKTTLAVLEAARRTPPGQTFAADGGTLTRSRVDPRTRADRVWADDPTTGKRRDLSREEDHAFWTWAIVEVLRATGIRVEELTELSHYSLVQYRLPNTGELVPLLQIAPSKTDAERLLVVSPDLADVLAAIISRVRDRTGAMPVVSAYDTREHAWSAPTPFLFQRRIGGENHAIPPGSVGTLLNRALAECGPRDRTGQPLRYTPHDFRRIFITDAILNGLPPHIAQIIAGHRDINVTMGYKAVYPEEAIQAHLAFLARRRTLRPTEEYRTPTDDEWDEFLGHFQRRKVSIGTCARAFGTPCIHEHACVRCPLLRPDPAQRPRLIEIRDNLRDRITEAHREGWLGEVEGLQVSLTGAEEKLAQIDRRPAPVNLGTPALAPTAT